MGGIKILMAGGMLLYSLAHLLAGIGLLQGKRWAHRTAIILSILGLLHLNPFALPGLIICYRANVKAAYQ